MSKLPHAPLQEVIFEIRWNVENKNDLESFQFISGDIYSSLKDEYPFRKSINSPEVPLEVLINAPVFQYRPSEKEYPLVQIGPGLLTFNSNDEHYFWDDFYNKSRELLDVFYNAFDKKESKVFYVNLIYLDFFPFDFENENVFDYLNNKFNLTINQSFFKPKMPPNNLNFSFNYITDLGNLVTHFKKGKRGSEDGIVLQTHLGGHKVHLETEQISSWLNNAHTFCSDLFKKMTEGDLHESFK